MAENILSTKVPEIIKYNVVLLLLNARESALNELYSLLMSINNIFRNESGFVPYIITYCT